MKVSKMNLVISAIKLDYKKVHKILFIPLLLTICKSFERPNYYCVHIIYFKTHNASFHQNLEKIQYSSALAITGAIRGTSKEKLCQELRLEYLEKDDGIRNSVTFIRFSKSNLLNTSLILLLCLANYTLQHGTVIQTRTTYSKILFKKFIKIGMHLKEIVTRSKQKNRNIFFYQTTN